MIRVVDKCDKLGRVSDKVWFITPEGKLIDCTFGKEPTHENALSFLQKFGIKSMTEAMHRGFVKVRIFNNKATNIDTWSIDDKVFRKLQNFYWDGKLEFSNNVEKHYWEGTNRGNYAIDFTKDEFLLSENVRDLIGGERYGNYLRLPIRVEM